MTYLVNHFFIGLPYPQSHYNKKSKEDGKRDKCIHIYACDLFQVVYKFHFLMPPTLTMSVYIIISYLKFDLC